MSNFFQQSTTLPGVTLNANPKEYHALGSEHPNGNPLRVMSRGQLMKFAKNPRKWRDGIPNDETRATEWGSLIDTMVLTPELLESTYVISPSTYPAPASAKKDAAMIEKPWNRNAIYCKEWEAEQEANGLIVVGVGLWTEAEKAARKLDRDDEIHSFIAASEKQVQVCVEYADKETGLLIPIKCLIDLQPEVGTKFEKSLGDLKTTNDASPGKWDRTIFDYDLHVQGGMYLDAFNVATGESRNQWRHAIQESSAPYATARRLMSDEWLNMGRAAYRNALLLYCQCLASNEWHGYDDLDDVTGGMIIDGWRVTDPAAWMVKV